MIWNIKLVHARSLLEALLATPSYVLQCQQGPIGRKNVIQVASTDERVVEGVDDMLKHAIRAWTQRSVHSTSIVAPIPKNVLHRALHPICPNWGVDGLLHVSAVEIDDLIGWLIVAWIDDAKNRPKMRAGSCDVVNVEAWVGEENSTIHIVKDIASRLVFIRIWVWEDGKFSRRRRECQILGQVIGVPTFVDALSEGFHESCIQVEKVRPVLDKGKDRDCVPN